MKRDLLISSWLPILWAGGVVVHFVYFVDHPEGGSVFAQVFDTLVMLSCFLLYPIHSLAPTFRTSLFPFAAQFLFWWVISLGIWSLYKRAKFAKTKP